MLRLNQASAGVYNALYSHGKVFKGSEQVELAGVTFNITYDCTQPPVFDLKNPSSEVLKAAFKAAIPHHYPEASSEDATSLAEFGAQTLASFSVGFAQCNFSFSSPGIPSVQLTTDLTAACTATSEGGSLSFAVVSVTAPPQPTPGAQVIVTDILIPAITTAANQLFKGLQIPPISIPGVALSAPAIVIANNHVYALLNLAASGQPVPPFEPPAFPQPFALGLSLAALNAVTTYAIGKSGTFSQSDSTGSSWAGANYSYSYQLTNPSVTLDGPNLNISFQLQGEISAGVTIVFIPIGLDFSGTAVPNPSARCSLVPQGSSLQVVAQSVEPFTLIVQPSGSIPSQVLGWMIDFIVQGVVGSLTPLITTFLHNISFTSIQIPSHQESIDGVSITFAPGNLSVQPSPNGIALVGDLIVTS